MTTTADPITITLTCPECEGVGQLEEQTDVADFRLYVCDTCNGEGQIEKTMPVSEAIADEHICKVCHGPDDVDPYTNTCAECSFDKWSGERVWGA